MEDKKTELELAKEILLKKAKEIQGKNPDWSLDKCLLEAAKLLEKLEEPEPEPEAKSEVEPEPEPSPEPEPEVDSDMEMARVVVQPEDKTVSLTKMLEERLKSLEAKIDGAQANKKPEMIFVRNDMTTGKPIKVTRQPEELAAKTGSKREYYHSADGIFCWD